MLVVDAQVVLLHPGERDVNAAGVIVLAGVEPDVSVLLLKRADTGEWCYPGGGIEDGEDAVEAAAREFKEETGVELPAQLSRHARRVADGVDYETFTCRVAAPFDVALNDEHTESAWVPLGEVAARGDAVEERDPLLPPDVQVIRHDVMPRAAGMYDPELKLLHVAAELALNDGSRRVLANPERLYAHERGHARDHAAGWPSKEDEFRRLCTEAYDRLTPEERLGAGYYLTDPGEAFAEAIAFADGVSEGARYFGTLAPQRVAEVLGDVISWAKGKVG